LPGGWLVGLMPYHGRAPVLDLHNDTLNPLKLHLVFPVTTDQLRYAAVEPVRNLLDRAHYRRSSGMPWTEARSGNLD
jgi:hypothetical protein